MRCGLFIISLLLILIAVVFFIIIVGGIDNPTLNTFLESIYCESGEEFTHESGPRRYDSTRGEYTQSVTYYCEGDDRQQRDVTNSVILMTICGFGGLLTSGILLLIFTVSLVTRPRKSQIPYINLEDMNPQAFTTHTGEYNQTAIPPETVERLQQVAGMLGQILKPPEEETLADKLQQLQEARDKGLITPDEYENLRQTILDNLSD